MAYNLLTRLVGALLPVAAASGARDEARAFVAALLDWPGARYAALREEAAAIAGAYRRRSRNVALRAASFAVRILWTLAQVAATLTACAAGGVLLYALLRWRSLPRARHEWALHFVYGSDPAGDARELLGVPVGGSGSGGASGGGAFYYRRPVECDRLLWAYEDYVARYASASAAAAGAASATPSLTGRDHHEQHQRRRHLQSAQQEQHDRMAWRKVHGGSDDEFDWPPPPPPGYGDAGDDNADGAGTATAAAADRDHYLRRLASLRAYCSGWFDHSAGDAHAPAAGSDEAAAPSSSPLVATAVLELTAATAGAGGKGASGASAAAAGQWLQGLYYTQGAAGGAANAQAAAHPPLLSPGQSYEADLQLELVVDGWTAPTAASSWWSQPVPLTLQLDLLTLAPALDEPALLAAAIAAAAGGGGSAPSTTLADRDYGTFQQSAPAGGSVPGVGDGVVSLPVTHAPAAALGRVSSQAGVSVAASLPAAMVGAREAAAVVAAGAAGAAGDATSAGSRSSSWWWGRRGGRRDGGASSSSLPPLPHLPAESLRPLARHAVLARCVRPVTLPARSALLRASLSLLAFPAQLLAALSPWGSPTQASDPAVTYRTLQSCFAGFVENGAHPATAVRAVLTPAVAATAGGASGAVPGMPVVTAASLTLRARHTAWQAFLTRWQWVAALVLVPLLTAALAAGAVACCVGVRYRLGGGIGFGLPLPPSLDAPGFGLLEAEPPVQGAEAAHAAAKALAGKRGLVPGAATAAAAAAAGPTAPPADGGGAAPFLTAAAAAPVYSTPPGGGVGSGGGGSSSEARRAQHRLAVLLPLKRTPQQPVSPPQQSSAASTASASSPPSSVSASAAIKSSSGSSSGSSDGGSAPPGDEPAAAGAPSSPDAAVANVLRALQGDTGGGSDASAYSNDDVIGGGGAGAPAPVPVTLVDAEEGGGAAAAPDGVPPAGDGGDDDAGAAPSPASLHGDGLRRRHVPHPAAEASGAQSPVGGADGTG